MSLKDKFFAQVSQEDWNDWKWQVRNRIETVEDLKKYLPLTPEEEEGIKQCLGSLRMAITPYYLSLIDVNDPNDPVRKQAVPTSLELHRADSDQEDPLHRRVCVHPEQLLDPCRHHLQVVRAGRAHCRGRNPVG